MKKNKNSTNKKIVSDSMGKIEIPDNVFYAAQTQRAINNFPIIFYYEDDSRPVGIRRQRTRDKKWKAYIVHGEMKVEIPQDIKIKDITKEIALSILKKKEK